MRDVPQLSLKGGTGVLATPYVMHYAEGRLSAVNGKEMVAGAVDEEHRLGTG